MLHLRFVSHHQVLLFPKFIHIGRIHSNTVTRSKKKGSNLLQIMSRSNRFSGFLTVEIKNEVVEIRSLNKVGTGWRWNNNYEQNGSVRIDKTDIKNVQINSYGKLKELDDNEAVIYFNFEGVHSISERQVFEMYDKKKNLLVTDSQLIGGANATNAFIIKAHLDIIWTTI